MGLQNSKIVQKGAACALPQTVLHVIDALNYGGAQQLLVLLAQWTPRDLYRTIICSLQTNSDLQASIAAKGVEAYVFNRPRPSIFTPHRLAAYLYRNIRDIIHICREKKVDILQCHLSDAEFIGILAGYLAGVKCILTTVHYPDLLPKRSSGDIRNFFRWFATRMIYRHVHHVIAVSEDVAHQLETVFGLDPSRIHVILNRIDVDAFAARHACARLKHSLGIGSKDRLITTVGRLMPPKGHSYLIDAVFKLVKEFPELKVLFVGDGDLRGPLEKQCKILGLQDTIVFLGSRRDIPELLALTEIFVLPSLWEGTSLALLEAMASRKPIVATDIPGNRSCLEHRKNSYLVPPADAGALAQAIAFMLQHHDTAQKYAENAFALARSHFDIRQTIAELEPLWGKTASV